jgi:polysaccharide export outer membrane protein
MLLPILGLLLIALYCVAPDTITAQSQQLQGTAAPQVQGTAAIQEVPIPAQQVQESAATPDGKGKTPNPELRIGVGDLIETRIYGVDTSPDVSQSSRVSREGFIWLPMIGQIHIAGLTTSEAQGAIAGKYKDGQFLKNPQVSVNITDYASEGVSVLGEVTKPGIYPIVTARTLLDMISTAGGLTPMGGSHVTVTHRASPGEPINVELGSPQQTMAIMPGDTIVVAKTGIVYVTGEVGKPGGFPLNNNADMTVLRVLALAEGTKPNAALDKAKLIRRKDGELSEQDIPLKKIMTGQAADVAVNAGDIVFVPNSAAKSATKRTLEAILQTATGMAIYHPY